MHMMRTGQCFPWGLESEAKLCGRAVGCSAPPPPRHAPPFQRPPSSPHLLQHVLLVNHHVVLAVLLLGLRQRGSRGGGSVSGGDQLPTPDADAHQALPALPPMPARTFSGASNDTSSRMRSRMVCSRRAPMLSRLVFTSSATRAISRMAASGGGRRQREQCVTCPGPHLG